MEDQSNGTWDQPRSAILRGKILRYEELAFLRDPSTSWRNNACNNYDIQSWGEGRWISALPLIRIPRMCPSNSQPPHLSFSLSPCKPDIAPTYAHPRQQPLALSQPSPPPGGWGAAVFALSTADDPRSWPKAAERLRGGAHRVSLRSRATLSSGRVAIPFSPTLSPSQRIALAIPRRRAAPPCRPCLTFVPLGSHCRIRKREKGSGRRHFDFSKLSCAMDGDKRMRWDCDRKLSPKVATTDLLIQLMYGDGTFGGSR